MENKESLSERTSLLDTYLAYNGLTLRSSVKGEQPNRDGMPFMPMLLMDAMNILFEEYIAPINIRHDSKRIRTRWHDAYKHFTSDFFRAFNDDQMLELCDMMNDFYDSIHNKVEMFRVAVMGRFMEYDTDVRLVLSATLACNIFAQSAQILWKALHGKSNDYIDSAEIWSYKFLNEYARKRINRDSSKIDLNKFSDVSIASKSICQEIILFAKGLKL